MYHDKRFQTDLYFPMVAFHDLQIKAGVTGSHLLAKRKNFGNIVKRLDSIDPAVLSDLSQRLETGEHVVPQNEAVKTCFDILKDLDHVGGHVQGSMTSKKYMRNEIWSLIAFKGAPSWVITFLRFTPKIRNSDERLRLIAQNPVAAARFFDHMTRAFIQHVLCVGSEDPGLYGHTDSYYGTCSVSATNS
ncbi:hypothetical protein C8R45DRAFT_1057318 [Mycena sanguinolenta]|nr:hypothetical protein C8R45DRAFT_1057318 [Mycena sanguinolenta]